MSSEFLTRSTELAPNWLGLTPHEQRATLLELLRHSPLSKGQMVHAMLASPPWPADEAEAMARAVTVIEFLTMGAQ